MKRNSIFQFSPLLTGASFLSRLKNEYRVELKRDGYDFVRLDEAIGRFAPRGYLIGIINREYEVFADEFQLLADLPNDLDEGDISGLPRYTRFKTRGQDYAITGPDCKLDTAFGSHNYVRKSDVSVVEFYAVDEFHRESIQSHKTVRNDEPRVKAPYRFYTNSDAVGYCDLERVRRVKEYLKGRFPAYFNPGLLLEDVPTLESSERPF